MKPAAFAYRAAASVAEAADFLAAHGGAAKCLAGGQSLGPMLNMRLVRVAGLVDISRVAELRQVDERGGTVRIVSSLQTAFFAADEIARFEEEMRRRPMFFAICSVGSPLQMLQMQLEGLMICADYGQPLAMSPEAIAGATAPVTLAGLLAQQNANILAHITLAQIYRPGTPVLYGTVSTIANMRLGTVALEPGVHEPLFRYRAGVVNNEAQREQAFADPPTMVVEAAQRVADNGMLIATGLEFFAGIPGTVGGALAMNAGAFGGETWAQVVKVETIDRRGNVRERSPGEFRVHYREVEKPGNEWFLSACFRLERGDVEAAQQRILETLDGRRTDAAGSGDFSFIVRPLPKISLCYIFYHADEDFPAAVTCLYSNNASGFMPIDGLADVGEYTSKKILALIDRPAPI